MGSDNGPSPRGTLYARLMALSEEAFSEGLYNAAYHALAAALHAAFDRRQEEHLLEVARVARERIAWLDANAPGYEHSRPSARARSHASIWDNLALQAETDAKLVGAGERRKPGVIDVTG